MNDDIKTIKEALEKLAKLGNEPHYGNSVGNIIAQKALTALGRVEIAGKHTRGENNMNDEQIKHMANRFLGWKLPADFRPDAGISFKPVFNEHTEHPQRHEPSGTNLLDYMQAVEMVRYMIEGIPTAPISGTAEGE